MKSKYFYCLLAVFMLFVSVDCLIRAESIWKTINVSENQAKVVFDGNPMTNIDNFLYNDTTYIPIRAVAENMGKKVSYDAGTYTVHVDSVYNKFAIIKDCICAEYEGSTGQATYDGDNDTVYPVRKGEWIIYEFDGDYDLQSVQISFLRGNSRKMNFSLFGSNDGISYYDIGDYCSTGTDDNQQFGINGATKVRYIKYLSLGNDSSDWTSIREIKFLVK